MLEKMGWKGEGSGLGKNQQGNTTHLRAIRRSESLGIGAETDAFGEKGWQDTNQGFFGVLASLQKEYGTGIAGKDDVGNDGNENEETRKRRKKEEKKSKKREEKRKNKNGSSSGDGVRLARNKVQAGHARKMREAKDIRNKSAEDMAAIFGVKADFYKQPQRLAMGVGVGAVSIEKGESSPEEVSSREEKRNVESRDSNKVTDSSSDAVTDQKEKKKSRKKDKKTSKELKSGETKKKEKKKRKQEDNSDEDQNRVKRTSLIEAI